MPIKMSKEMSEKVAEQKVVWLAFLPALITAYGIKGEVIDCQPIIGGTLHSTWKLITTQGSYALRKVNLELLKLQNKSIYFCNQAEQIAELLTKQAIPAVVAIKNNGNYVQQLGKDCFMLFPWIAGACLADAQINCEHAAAMGALLANIHNLQLKAELEFVHWQAFTAEHWQGLFLQAEKYAWYPQIMHMLNNLLNWSRLVKEVLPLLKKDIVLSHRDLNSLNIIWDAENKPKIIDWEFAGLINPTLELFIVAINWSRVGVNNIEQERYQSVLTAYRQQQNKAHIITPTIIHGYLGYCMDWLEFNLRRALAFENDVIAVQEIFTTYNVIQYVYQYADSLLD